MKISYGNYFYRLYLHFITVIERRYSIEILSLPIYSLIAPEAISKLGISGSVVSQGSTHSMLGLTLGHHTICLLNRFVQINITKNQIFGHQDVLCMNWLLSIGRLEDPALSNQARKYRMEHFSHCLAGTLATSATSSAECCPQTRIPDHQPHKFYQFLS